MAHEHVVFGAQLAGNIVGAEDIAPAIKYHHERCDGKGFPEAVAGDEIPLLSRIISVADRIDHSLGTDVTQQRISDCKEELRRESGNAFEPGVVEAACEALSALEAQE